MSRHLAYYFSFFLSLASLFACSQDPSVKRGRSLQGSISKSGIDQGAGKEASGTESIDPTKLYAVNCASCHGDLGQSEKRGSSARSIATAIENVPEMLALKYLTDKEIAAIAELLGGDPALDPQVTPTGGSGGDGNRARGESLYASHCVSCHLPIAETNIPGASAVRISTAITNVPRMQRLSFLSDSDIQAIAEALAPKDVPLAKPVLYANRYQLEQRFSRVFSANQTTLNNKLAGVTSMFHDQKFAFAGICSPHEVGCSKDIDYVENEIFIPHAAGGHILRKGWIIQACDTLLADNERVEKFVEARSMNKNAYPSLANVRVLADHFRPGFQLGTPSIDAYSALIDTSKSKNFSKLDTWRMVLVPLCKSLAMEKL